MQRKMLKLLSVLLLICTICVVFGMTRPTEADAATATKLVLKVNSEWTSDGARFAAYFFGNGEKWVSMTSQGNNIYTCSVPSGYSSVIFVRMNGGNTTNSWDNKWNQSSDLTVPADTSCMYTMKSGWWDGDVGTWGACSHSWNSGTVTKQATCAATGVKTYTCNWCAGTKTETIAKTTNHNYAAATCTVAKKCTVCGVTSGSALGHSYSYAKNVNPTESATGSIKGTCSRCKGTTTVSLPKLNTSNYTRTQTKAPTCTATGTYSWTWNTKTYGTFTYTSSIPAKGHSYGNASCSAPATCSTCGTTTGSALGHNYTNYATVTAPTTSATGSIKGKCSRCTATNTVTLPALNTTNYTRTTTKAATCTATGTYSWKWKTTTYGTFTYTSTIAKTAHSYAAATCTKPQTCSCGATTGSALGHNYTNYAKNVNPTTSATGSIKGTCSRCSDTNTVTVPKLNTTDYTRTTTTAATCTATGTYKWTWKTTTYGTFSWNTTIDKLAHSYAAATCTKPQTCSCGATTGSALGHSYSSKVTTAATCTAAGVRTYTCSRCSDSYTESIAAIGHSYSGGKCANCGDTKVVSVNGDFNSWSGANMTYSSSGYTYSIKLSAGTYKFKVIKDGTWLGNNGEIWDTTTATSSVGWEFADWGGDCTLVATGGTYNFTFIYDTNMLIITYTHTHAYTAGTVVAPTCTAKGYTVYTCPCGDSYNGDEKAALGHSYTSSVTKAATCTADGVRTYTCSRCSDSYTEAITKLGHDYKATVTAPTCTAQGYTTHTCSRCSDSYKDSYKAALGHNYQNGACQNCGDSCDHKYTSKVTKDPTCTAAGVRTYTCSVCGGSYTEAIEKLGHSYSSKVTAPTCTEQGYTTYTCSRCSYSYKDNYKDASGHSYSSSVTKTATCTADGVRTYTCSKCNHSYTEAIAKLGHKYESKVTAPTCTAEGYTTYTCSRCSDTYKDNYVAANGHSYVGGKCSACGDTKVVSINGTFNGWAGANMTYGANGYTYTLKLDAGTYQFKIIKDGTWLGNDGDIADTTTATSDIGWEFVDWAGDCDLIATGGTYTFTFHYDTNFLVIEYVHTHAYAAGEVVAPTCTAKGYTVYTCPCGDSYHGDEKAALGHSYSSKVTTEATCTTDGVRTYTCSRCSDSYTEAITKLGHDYKATVTAPTCTAQGYTTHTCSRCSDSYKDSYKAALGHNYQNGACQNCGDSCDHKYTSKVTKDPTCTTDGVRTYTCSVCGGSYTEAIEKLGHDYKATVTAPTCTAEGYTTHTCSRCDDSYKDSYVDKLGHSYTEAVVDATCTEDGLKTFTCSRCSDSYTEVIKATGHSYVGGKCGNCGDTKVVSVNGTFNGWAGQNMTWTENGYTINIVLPAGTYQFKIIKDGTWLGNDGDIADTTTATSDIGWEFVDWAGDCDLIATGGTYTFTFHYDTNFLVIEYVHTHAYAAGEVVAPTCTAKGYTVYTCPCGDSYHGDEKAALGHSYSSKVTTEATCTTDGVRTYTCSRCSDSYTEAITKLGHDYKATVTAPTCTAQGYTTHTCSRCSDSYKDSYKAALGHNYQNGACQNCGDSCDHKYTSKVTKDPTCTTDGVRTYTCSVCGGSYTEAIEKLGHSYSSKVTAPTCTAEGYTTYTCGTCGDTYNADFVDALGHSYTEAVVDATCTEDGLKTFTCSRCGDSYTEVIPATGHSYASGKCGNCGDTKVVSVNGTFNDWAGQNMTWTENGYTINIVLPAGTYQFKVIKDGTWLGNDGDIADTTTATSDIGWEFVDWAGDCDLIATGGTYTFTFHYDTNFLVIEYVHTHAYAAGEVIAPTCTEKGYTVYTCACGDSYNGDEVDALGHDYKATVTAPTCTTEGYTTHTCAVCGDSYTDSETAALGHSFVGTTCTVCGHVRDYYLVGWINGADYGFNDDAANIGQYKFVNGKLVAAFTSDCYVFIKTGDNLSWYQAEGYCEDKTVILYNDELGLADPNKLFVPGGVEVTFTLVVNNDETLVLSYEITNCSHNYNEGQITKTPTCTEKGEMTYTCTICGHSYTEEIAALGHKYESKVTAPTCTAGGYTTYTCSVCGDTYTDDEVDALGHSYSEEVTDATCTEDGLKTFTCGTCGHSYTEVIPATGHNFINGTCTNCGAADPDMEYITVYFQNNWLWTDVYAYVWTDDGPIVPWPGEEATFYANDGTYDIYCVTIPEGANVIFNGTKNDGSGASDQTADILGAEDGDCYWNVWNGENAVEKDNILNIYCEHNYTGEQTKAPTCTEKGELTYTCSKCGKSYTEQIDALGHKHEAKVTEPTCTAGGYTTYTCACGDSYTADETEALGHNFVDGTCDRCGEKEPVAETITVYFQNNWLWTDIYAYVWTEAGPVVAWPGTPATFYANDGTYDIYCVTIPADANVIFNGTKNDGSGAADQTPDITDAYDGACYSMVWNGDENKNGVVVDDIENVMKPTECEHSYTTEITAPTCTEPGHTTYTCSKCGHSYTEEIAATGHNYVDGICTNCGAAEPVVDYYLIGYINGADYGCNDDGDNMGEYKFVDGQLTVTFESNSYVFVKTTGNANWYMFEGYCEQTSGTLYNTNSGLTDANKMFVPGGVEVTFTLTVNDNDTLTLSYAETACEHSYTEQITKAPTCTEAGIKTFTCSKCGDSYTEEISALGHSYVNGICSVCGHSQDDNIKIHFVNTLGWQGVVGYAWVDTNGTTSSLNGITWPGIIVQRDNEGYYTLELEYAPVSGQSIGVLFHDFSGNQTADVLIGYEMLRTSHEIWVKPATSKTDGKYACSVATSEGGMVISPEINGQQVTFRYAGSASSVYLAGSMNGWSTSATAMTKGEDGVWSVTLTLDPGVYEYKFVVDGSWILDPTNGHVGGYDGNSVLVVPADDVTTNNGRITVVLHFYRASGDYSGWDVWYWGNGTEGAASFSADPANKGMIATFTVDGTKNSNVGYTVRKTDWSDKEFYDRFIDLSDVVSGTVHYYVNSGVATGSRVLGEDVVSVGKLSYANYDYESSTVWVKAALPLANPIAGNFSIVDGSGNATGITVTSATLDNYGYKLTLSKALSITQANTYKVKYESYTADIHLDTTDLFYSSKFASEYTYYGDDLGATWGRNSTTFKVWAPTALNVHVKIYDSGNYGSGNQVQYVQMTPGDKGVWTVTVPGNWHGYYYNYDVTFESYTVEATDPYARSTGANGDRGMILNLDTTDPAGWANDISPNQGMSYTDAIIYELHVREFTNDSNSGVNSAWRGNYLGLTQSGTSYNGHATGLDYLKELGITHVQLMPVTDFSSVDEYHDGYAWGYDPKNFNVPEGSYSTNPFDGSVRVNEFKQMVQTLHANGINVTMDVVFNHAFDGGNFCYNQIVPNYFSRFYGEGNWSNGSGVGNDLATERSMTRNFIVDTILYWVEEYHIDGFRFDLAGLIDTQTINEVVSAVHAKHPYVIFYGEGWAAGDTAVEYGYDLATKGNAWKTPGFGYFNDDYRNGIAGDNGNSWGFASGSWDYEYALADWFKASNTFSNTPSQTINYVSCHDNYCLTDKLLISRDGAYWEEIAKMNRLSNAIVMMSEGVSFLYSGDEMLRERKDYNGNRLENAHMGGDYSNTINWADLEYKQYANETSDYYKGLIEFRKNHAALRISDSSAQNYVTFHRISDQTVMFYISGYPNYECSDGIVVIFNASSSYTNVDLYNYGIPTGNYQAVIHGDKAGVTPLWGVDVTSSSGSVGVEGISTTVLVLGDLVHEESVYNKQPSKCGHASHNISGMCNSCGKTVDHTFVNGTCACGLSQSAPATYTVYYDNSTTNWSNVNIYAWTTTAGQTKEYAGTWSGSAMTLVDEENNIYAYELPVGAANVIFSGDGSQTDNLNAPGYLSDATMYSDGSWVIYEGACEHSYTDSYIEEPTCILGGVVKHTCSKCGYSYTEEVEALGHDYVAEVTEATCVSGGYTTYTCSRCDDSYVDDETAALRHDYVDGICSVCGTEKAYFLFGYINGANYGSDGDEATMGIYKFVDGQLTVTFKQDSYVGVKTIDNENWYMTDGYLGEDVTSATLYDTSVGINANKLFVPGQMKITFTMTVNEDGTITLSYEAAACEHEYSSVVTEPTCTEAGYTTHTCSFCGDSYTDTETEALGHDFADGFCQRCGAIDPATCEHEYGEGVVTEPTCTEGGFTTTTCTLCGHEVISDETAALGHTHEAVVTEPTCTEPGYTTYTCSCGDTYTADETEALGHNFVDGFCDRCGAVDPATCEHEYESVVTEPTCTEGGFTTKTCSICGNVEITDETEPAGHSYETVVTEPTCTEPGYTTYTCTVCGDSYTGDETEIIDHSFVDGACENCGAIDPAVCEHSYGEGVVTEPTCTAKGYTTYTCDLCGHSYTADETEMVDHSFVDGVCENCGEVEGDTPVCEHEYVKSAADATCTEPGGDKYTCSKCGDVYYENATEPLGHSYVDGICERCGDLKPLSTTYYLVGWINGGNHGCEEDSANMGNYKITDNMFKFTFDQTSYVFLKTEGNGKWFMCDGYPGDGVCFANLYDTSLPINHDKVNVPGGVEITFTLIERDDGSVTLTYVTAGNCSHNWYTQTQVWPGCTTTGVMLHRCIMCAESYTTTIPAKGHSFNGGSNCWDCGAANPNYTYYYQIVGWINGQNVGCEENWEQPGYQFSGNRLTMTFTENSYIYIKTHDNSKWYMTDGYPGDDATSATFYHTDSYWEIQKDKMFVPKGRTITFTLSVRSDNTIYLSYVAASCQHTYDSWMNVEATCTTDGERAYKCTKCDDYYTEVVKATGHKYSGTSCTVCGAVAPGQDQIYYLIGYINGADYGCNGDASNMGIYKFVDGQLVATFSADSYVYIKTQGNTAWYMTQSFVQTNSGTFYNTSTGANEKMLVKAGTEYRFTLVENADGSLTLTYGPSNCTHTNVTEEITAPTCTEGGYTTLICNDCGNREITNETEPTGHSFVDGACEHCGAIDPATCQHSYGEGTVTAPTCTAKGYTTYICTICGYEHIGDETDMIPHDFVDGICTVCGAEEDDGMITVYFQNNWLWSDVFVYYWNDNGSNAEWPGEPATWYANDGTYDIYCVTMPAGSKVIFSGTKNDGSGTSDQTPDIEDAQDGDCYYMTWNDGNAVGKENIDNIIGECEHEYEATVTEPGCKTPGYTTHKCKLCGDEYVDTHTAPVGHNFVGDVCIVCGEAKVEENQDFYLIGYINGANYGCDEDWENLGIYKFVDGKLVAHFKSDSYVFVKTGDNLGWYMTEGFGGTEIPYAELFNTNIGLTDANKLFVPGGMKITFVLVRTGEDTFILGYTVSECEHPEHTVTGKCVYCGASVEHDYQITVNDYTCTEMGGVTHECACGASYVTDTVPASGHNFVDGVCVNCGIADESGCAHEFELTVDPGKCNLSAYTVNTCKHCGHTFNVYNDANMDWTMVKPVDVHESLLITKPMYSYRDRETTTADTDTLEGWELIGSELIDEELGTYLYTFQRWSNWSDWSDEEVTASEDREVQTATAYRFAEGIIGEHEYVEVVTDPTCTEMGYTTVTCSICGESYIYNYTDALGHSYEDVVTAPGCTTQGYTTHTCSVCGDSYTDSYTDPTGHSFNDGQCECGAYALQALSLSLTLESEVKYNLYFSLNDPAIQLQNVGLLTFKSQPTEATLENADFVLDTMVFDANFNCNAMRSQGIPAKEMSDALYMRLYATMDDGTVIYGKLISYSAKTFATNTLNRASSSETLKNTVVALMNYGAEAQKLFGYKTDSLMNADIPAEYQDRQIAYSADLLDGVIKADSAKAGSLTATAGAFNGASAQVTLDGALSINFLFLPGKTVDGGKMTMYYWSAGTYASVEELTLDNADGSVETTINGSLYQGIYDGIAAKEMDDTVYVLAVYESDGETCLSGIVSYSIEQFCRSQVSKATQNTALCEKLTIYSYYTKVYFNVD